MEHDIKITWQKQASVEDIKLELDERVKEIQEYKNSANIDVDKLNIMQMDLIDTYNMAQKLGVTYTLEEI